MPMAKMPNRLGRSSIELLETAFQLGEAIVANGLRKAHDGRFADLYALCEIGGGEEGSLIFGGLCGTIKT